MAKGKNLEDMGLDELKALDAELAEERHELRLKQKAVADAITFRTVQLQLPPDLRNRIVLSGVVGSEGGKN